MCTLCLCDGALGFVFVLSCRVSYAFGFEDFLLYSLICASRSFLLIDVENISKNPANKKRVTLACLLTCVCIVHVL